MHGLAIFLLLVVSIETGMPLSLSQRSLSYTVDVSISKPRITKFRDNRVNLTFTISGFGDFLNATVQLHSDAANLFLNTFYLQGFYVGTNGLVYQWLDEYPRANSEEMAATAEYSFRGINCEWVDYDVCAEYSMYSSVVKITGSMILDSSAIDPGSYYVTIAFIAHTVVTDYMFNSSLSYQVLDFWQEYFWVPWVILVAAFFFAVAVLRLRRSRKQVLTLPDAPDH
jgi:hypothetical protein